MGITFSSTNQPTNDWKPELPDFRDEIYKYPKINVRSSDIIDLRNNFKEYTYNFGSSASTSIASVLDSYNLKYTFDNSNLDSITSIRNCIKKFKVVDENDVEHTAQIDNEVNKKKRLKYTKLCNFKNQLRQSLKEGYPVIFGFTVYESFNSEEVKRTGIIRSPSKDEKIIGGLCAVIVGYNGAINHWIVRHPFGKEFGDNGYIYIPCDILAKNNNLTSDFWRITYN